MMVNQILIYTKVPYVKFHLELVRQLAPIYPGVPIRFLTFHSLAAKRVSEAGYDVLYLPELINDCQYEDFHVDVLDGIDRELQKDLGVGLNLLALTERFLPSEAVAGEDFIRRHAVVLDQIVSEQTLSISPMYDHFVYFLAGALANARGGWHFAFVGTAVPRGNVVALKTPWETWCVEHSMSGIGSIDELQQQLLSPSASIEYMQPNPFPSLFQRLPDRLALEWAAREDKRCGSYFSTFSWGHFLFGTKAFSRYVSRGQLPAYQLEHIENLQKVTKGQPFFYVPLHFEPEATVLMYSPWLQDQIEMCRLLSQALPIGTLLLVKENPKMHRKRPLSYYRKLERLPGVRLVHPSVPSMSLIEEAGGVISLAGNACLEATVLGKPSLLFGRPPFYRAIMYVAMMGDDGLPLDRLNEWMASPESLPTEVQASEIDRWLRSTFVASSTPRRQKTPLREVDSSPTNAGKFLEFIRLAMQL